MMRSLNEISCLVAKAARGAGLAVGVAEDLAEALPGCCADQEVSEALAVLADHLAGPDRLASVIAALDVVEAGGEPVVLEFPLDPVIAALIRQRGTIVWRAVPSGLSLAVEDCPPLPRPKPQNVLAEVWGPLERFAAQTYVPATEASRIAGAGAGLSDND
ncbi:hypothetical protein LOM8899_00764 [Flavimaricola marinus]|uniref:Uncharacterized protein n=2 Tax=Flavimaricola marinus TaxID=1819565 RepID=A0A238LA87_9RHOB|nr:hypothetical protein LOM8899_00764 [Flavimaricola marinus]